MSKNFMFTSESVGAGHPDKVADQISDAVLDALLAVDPMSRVAAETLCTTGLVVMAGEITSKHPRVDDKSFYEGIARNVLRQIGYTDPAFGIDATTCEVQVRYDRQSPDIAQGVDSAHDTGETGAGDQGIMFGYACNETAELMPLAITLAHKLMQKQEFVRNSTVNVLRPDAKSQVTLRYENGVPVGVDTVVISTQHADHVRIEDLRHLVAQEIILPVLQENCPALMLNTGSLIGTRVLVNPTGRFVVGGPEGDCGLTGRKIIVDTYGGACPHGGGAFSGKDPTKQDRSAAYMARWVAKHIVASGLATKALVQLSYAIGVAEPVSIMVETYGTGVVGDEIISDMVIENFDLTPDAIIERLDLRRPIYQQTASYGHFGRVEFPWEQLDVGILAGMRSLLNCDAANCQNCECEGADEAEDAAEVERVA